MAVVVVGTQKRYSEQVINVCLFEYCVFKLVIVYTYYDNNKKKKKILIAR